MNNDKNNSSVHDILIVVYDLETTGFYPACIFSPVNKIIQISAATLSINETPSVSFSSFVDPKCKIHTLSTKIHGISNKHVAGKNDIKMVFQELCNVLQISLYKKVIFVAHNNNFFDEPVLRREVDNLVPENISFWDTLPFFREKYPGLQSYSLTNLYFHFFNKTFDGAHNAENDVQALIEICKRYVDFDAYTTFSPEAKIVKITDYRYIGKYRAELIYKKLGIHDPIKFKQYFKKSADQKHLDKFIQRELKIINATERITLICLIYDISLWEWNKITDHIYYNIPGYVNNIDYYLFNRLHSMEKSSIDMKYFKKGLFDLNELLDSAY